MNPSSIVFPVTFHATNAISHAGLLVMLDPDDQFGVKIATADPVGIPLGVSGNAAAVGEPCVVYRLGGVMRLYLNETSIATVGDRLYCGRWGLVKTFADGVQATQNEYFVGIAMEGGSGGDPLKCFTQPAVQHVLYDVL